MEANNVTASPSSMEGRVLVLLTLPVSFPSSKWFGSWLHGFFRGADSVLDDLQRIQVLGAFTLDGCDAQKAITADMKIRCRWPDVYHI
jgi:hypothetical protein